MAKIIHSCKRGLITQGVVDSSEAVFRTRIFLDDPENLVGFRRALKQYVRKDKGELTQYFEVGYFMELLYEGDLEAFQILLKEGDDVEFSYFDFDILKSSYKDLISRTLVNRLMEEAARIYETLEDPEHLGDKVTKNKNEFLVEKLAYNNKNAYICFRNLMLVEKILGDNDLRLSDTSKNTLQAIRDGSFSLTALRSGYEMHLEKVEELEKVSELPLRPDFETMNTILFKIRNVTIKTLNTTEG